MSDWEIPPPTPERTCTCRGRYICDADARWNATRGANSNANSNHTLPSESKMLTSIHEPRGVNLPTVLRTEGVRKGVRKSVRSTASNKYGFPTQKSVKNYVEAKRCVAPRRKKLDPAGLKERG